MAVEAGGSAALPLVAETGQEEPPDEDGPELVVQETDPSGRFSRSDQLLGRGAFKTVFKAFDEEEGIEVAWNQVRVSELVSSKEERDRLFAEIRVLKQLKHKNIMTFYDSWLDNKGHTVNFITEYFTSGTLRQYRKRHKHIDNEVLKRWAWQILCGLVYLHGHNPPIIHRDLKCDNIFINGSEGVVKIGDLGLATMLRARTAPQSVLGTPEFMAPELYDEEYDDRVDVYSFGMCLLELATLEYPYSECKNAAQIYRKVTLGVRPHALQKVPTHDLAEFISLCIAPREERPRTRQLLKHAYFDSIRTEKCSLKLSAEALGVSSLSSSDLLAEYASSAASSSVSRTSSAAAELHHDHGLLLEAVPEMETEGEAADDEPALMHMRVVHPEDASPHADEPRPKSTRGASEGGESAMDSVQTVAGSHARTGSAASRPHSEMSEGGSPHVMQEGQEANQREFRVKGRLQEDEQKLNLRLRITQPGGTAQVVEFDFDLVADTAISVASEMVDEMSLSPEDARSISMAIKDEIRKLTKEGSYSGESDFSSGDEHEHGREAGPEAMFSFQRTASTSTAEEVGEPGVAPRPPSQSGDSVVSTHEGATGAADTLSGGPQPMQHDGGRSTSPFREPDAMELEVHHPLYTDIGSPMHITTPLGSSPESTTLEQFGGHEAPPQPFGSVMSLLPERGLLGGLQSMRSVGSSAGNPPQAAASDLSRSHSEHELAATEQALSRKRSGSGVMSPPKEDDRKLPMKKGYEEAHPYIALPPLTVAVDAGLPRSTPVSTGFLPYSDRPPSPEAAPLRTSSSIGRVAAQLAGSAQAPGHATDVRRMSADDASVASGILAASHAPYANGIINGQATIITAGSAPASKMPSRDESPVREHAGDALILPLPVISNDLLPPNPVVRTKSKVNMEELKELRRKQAIDAMKNMEFKSLEGLDTFGLARGCLKQPGSKGTPRPML